MVIAIVFCPDAHLLPSLLPTTTCYNLYLHCLAKQRQSCSDARNEHSPNNGLCCARVRSHRHWPYARPDDSIYTHCSLINLVFLFNYRYPGHHRFVKCLFFHFFLSMPPRSSSFETMNIPFRSSTDSTHTRTPTCSKSCENGTRPNALQSQLSIRLRMSRKRRRRSGKHCISFYVPLFRFRCPRLAASIAALARPRFLLFPEID